jgi:multidrug resistance efflux pump
MLAGSGIVEAQNENVPIGTPVPGVVEEVMVDVKDHRMVKKGDPLFRLDDRSLRAELIVRGAALGAAQAKLDRLARGHRPEDEPVIAAVRAEAENAIEEARARLESAKVTLARSTRLHERDASAASEYDRDRFAYAEAKASVAKAQATFAKADSDYKRLLAGSWEEDLDVARAEVLQAEAAIKATEIELDRLIVRAPRDGEVLKVHVRPGQMAATAWNEPMIVLGDLSKLHVRVDIDEHDLSDFHAGARAWATPRGDPTHKFELQFVKVEPYVIPKRSLTGDNTERVDTRVLQVIFAIPDQRSIDVYVGQQMDIYIEVPKAAEVSEDSNRNRVEDRVVPHSLGNPL